MMIIPRKETTEIAESKNWIFVFGRRKTGKSFLVKNFVKWDDYFFVKRDRTIISEKDGEMNYDSFLSILKRDLNENKTAVVDEFHRLGDGFFDFLHSLDRNGKLIIISSTLFLAKKLLSKKSPILGLFAESPVRIIALNDTLAALRKLKMEKKELLENAIFIREPLLIKPFDEFVNARESFSKFLISSLNSVPSFVGEIFSEEEKTLSGIYEGILRAIATGKINSTEISNYLFSKKLIANNDPSIVQQYLKNLVDFGLIKRIAVWNKNKFIYKHISPLTQVFYYADEKYNTSEREVSLEEIKRIVSEIMPHIVEDNIRDFFSLRFGSQENIVEAKDYDIDALLLKFRKPEIAIEVKWRSNITKDDIKKAEEVLGKMQCREKWLFVQDKSRVGKVARNIKILDVGDLF